MALAHVTIASGLALGILGVATSTDAVSLRAVAHTVDVPLLSASVVQLRQAMGTNLAHTLEPLCAALGGAILLTRVPRPSAARVSLALTALGLH
jgi:hypothetical protein